MAPFIEFNNSVKSKSAHNKSSTAKYRRLASFNNNYFFNSKTETPKKPQWHDT